MQASTKKRLRTWLWPVAGTLTGIAQMVQASGNIMDMSWKQILEHGIKAAPFVIFGLIARHAFLDDPEEKKDAAP